MRDQHAWETFVFVHVHAALATTACWHVQAEVGGWLNDQTPT